MDQSFDGIAKKFGQNIYGTAKGKVRHAILKAVLADVLENRAPMRILDLGGGSGVMAKECLEWGHSVDIVDTSEDILNLAQASLEQYSQVRFFHQSLQTFSSDEPYDLVLCHAVMEWLRDPLAQLSSILKQVKPQGLLSLSVFNKDAALFGNMAYGNFEYVDKGMKVKNQVRLNPKNPVSPKALLDELARQRFDVLSKTGIRCFLDYVKRPVDDAELPLLIKLEKQFCQQEPYVWLGKYFHVLARPINPHPSELSTNQRGLV